MRDLDRVRRRELQEAREGWSPIAVEFAFEDAPIRVAGDRTLLLSGVIDRIDAHSDGRQRALAFFSGRELPEARGFVNGSSFLSVAYLTALIQRGAPIRQAEVELRSISSRGSYASQTLLGESLTTRGGRGAPSDGELLRDSLAVVVDGIESGSFIPNPGNPPRERPNCRVCAYESACTVDVAERRRYKARQDQEAVRELDVLRGKRV